MRLSWNEIRTRAAAFAEDWQNAFYEKGESQTFYDEFFQVFDIKRRRVASFEEPVKKLGEKRGYIDLFWKGVLIVEQKSAGKNLITAKKQALDYFPGLKEYELPRYILVSDFQNFELYDLDTGEETKFSLSQLSQNIEKFSFILGVEKRTFKDQDPANMQAAELMGKLHDALEESGYDGHNLERFLVRILFCLFADDTGIFEPRDIFLDLIKERTREDGSDLGMWLSKLFEVLNKPEEKRQTTLDEDLKDFPYINGDLFSEILPIPDFDSGMRKILIEACEFSWSSISPAIFGSLFQSVMNKEERRKQGAHYTTEKNIMKVIQPLFLDDLREKLGALKAKKGTNRRKELEDFHTSLSKMKFFDPACGCGNFLVIAYRELRDLEIEILKELFGEKQNQQKSLGLDVTAISKIDVDQFYGIEIGEFPARIAEVAMWMMDHIMNNKLSLVFFKSYARIPLKKSPVIRHDDALEVKWEDVLPSSECNYIFGNPPFIGSKNQSPEQRIQIQRIAALGGSGGTLDYVSAWFIKAGEYMQERTHLGFVSTNSITQGEQVAQLWPILFNRHELEISFAHRTFAWGSDARGKAQVHVVIIGLTKCKNETKIKRLFNYEDVNADAVESKHSALSPYLFDAGNLKNPHLVIEETSHSLCEAPKMIIGSKPIDGGYLIFDNDEREDFIKKEPLAGKYLKPFIGGVEYLQGKGRWILALQAASPTELRAMPHVVERLKAVREYRLGERPAKKKVGTDPKPPGTSARSLADTPTNFHVTVIPTAPFLAVPENSSEARDYLPIGWLEPPIIPSNKLRFIKNADLWHFGVLTSRMHIAWLRYVGGKIKSDFQYSIGIVYNCFPWPKANEKQMASIRDLAKKILDVRASFPDATLADLYDSSVMKPELRRAHQNLDKAIDNLYKPQGFDSDRSRVEYLFSQYEKLQMPVLSVTPSRKTRSQKNV